MLLRVCVVCQQPFAGQGSRCPLHPRPVARRNKRLRAAVAASATVCPECGQAPIPTNGMTADHIVPQRYGGQDEPGNLRPRCKSCNSRGGAALVNG